MSEFFEGQGFLEIEFCQTSKKGETACGDSYQVRKSSGGLHASVVLSDGLGSGIKASVLSTLTSVMALNSMDRSPNPSLDAQLIYRTLPECGTRKIRYSTFTGIGIRERSRLSIFEYENPPVMVFRKGKRRNLILCSEKPSHLGGRDSSITESRWNLEPGDRVVLVTDGVTQSGMGTRKYPFGWGSRNLTAFIEEELERKPDISARDLARLITIRSQKNDGYSSKDDTTAGVLYYRKPRELMLCSGPPFLMDRDAELAQRVKEFKGRKILAGGSTALIISREWGEEVDVDLSRKSSLLPPSSRMKGVDLITEGILTLGRVGELLVLGKTYPLEDSPAGDLLGLLLESDIIHILAGTKINEAHQNPNMPVELEIRRNIIKKITHLLRDKYFKEVILEFI